MSNRGADMPRPRSRTEVALALALLYFGPWYVAFVLARLARWLW